VRGSLEQARVNPTMSHAITPVWPGAVPEDTDETGQPVQDYLDEITTGL
jgi:hypothetical protein